jgi:hypothetical protein
MRLAHLSAAVVGGVSRLVAMPPTLSVWVGLFVQSAVAHVARDQARKEEHGSMDVLLILVLIGVVLWATGHLVMH